MRRFLIALQLSIVIAALFVGASVGYLIRPASVVVVSAAPGVSADSCLFAAGHKLGC